jgi:putative membrane protein
MSLLVRWLLLTVALLFAVYFVPGLAPVPPLYKLFLASAAMAALNLLATPALWFAKVVTFPLSCVTLGCWTIFLSVFVNALILYFIGTLKWGFEVKSWFGAFLGALLVGFVNAVLNGIYAASRRRKG